MIKQNHPFHYTYLDKSYAYSDKAVKILCVKSTKPNPDLGMQQHDREQIPRVGVTRIGTISSIPSILIRMGKDPVEVVTGAGIDFSLFDDPDNLITFAARSRLVAHCATRTGCRHFGLLVGQQSSLHSLGIVGLVAKYSPDLATALRYLVSYLRVTTTGAVASLDVIGNVALFGYAICQPNTEATEQIADSALAFMCKILRDLCGSAWKPVEIMFAHRKPEDILPYQQYFKASLHFDAEQNAIVFPTKWLEFQLPNADPELCRQLQKKIDKLATRESNDFPEQVRRVLRTTLMTKRSSADQIAGVFSLHNRTFRRRLSEHGVSFQKLVDEVRFEKARQMLEDSSTEIGIIAAFLDYASPSAFTRAFRRWAGSTPAQWRTRLKKQVSASLRQ